MELDAQSRAGDMLAPCCQRVCSPTGATRCVQSEFDPRAFIMKHGMTEEGVVLILAPGVACGATVAAVDSQPDKECRKGTGTAALGDLATGWGAGDV